MTLPDPLPPISQIPCPGSDLIALAESLLPSYDQSHQTLSRIIALKLLRSNADWLATVSSHPIPLKQAKFAL